MIRFPEGGAGDADRDVQREGEGAFHRTTPQGHALRRARCARSRKSLCRVSGCCISALTTTRTPCFTLTPFGTQNLGPSIIKSANLISVATVATQLPCATTARRPFRAVKLGLRP